MTKRSSELLAIPGFAIAMAVSLAGAIPVKEFVKSNTEVLGPLAASTGMLASFVVFLLIFAMFAAPTAILWDRYQKKEIMVEKPKQVIYGYHTPAPR